MQSIIQTKSELLLLLQGNAEYIKLLGINELGIFGSFRHDAAQKTSDIDLLVNFDPSKKTYQNLFTLHEFLTAKTGRKVEVVTKQGLNKHIGPHILNDVEYVQL